MDMVNVELSENVLPREETQTRNYYQIFELMWGVSSCL